jgi:LuxR family maltose regulon positive regulatory protein
LTTLLNEIFEWGSDVLLVLVYLAERRYGEAWHWLEALRTRAENDQRRRDVIQYLAWQVAVLQCSGETAQAGDLATRLLTEAEPEGYVRMYLEVGEPMKQVLQHFL